MTFQNQTIDITSFDAVAESESGYEFELKAKDEITGTGVFLTIVGKHAEVVNKWLAKMVNASIRDQQMAQRKGKQVEAKSLEELREQNLEGAVLRVTGWRNVSQPFTKELLANVLQRNPHFIDQIIAESDNLGNFTKKPVQS